MLCANNYSLTGVFLPTVALHHLTGISAFFAFDVPALLQGDAGSSAPTATRTLPILPNATCGPPGLPVLLLRRTRVISAQLLELSARLYILFQLFVLMPVRMSVVEMAHAEC